MRMQPGAGSFRKGGAIPMRRNAKARMLAVLILCLGAASISTRADDGLPLTPPAGQPPAIEAPAGATPIAPRPIPAPSSPKPTTPPAIPARDDRPVLALPGITTPAYRAPRTEPSTTAALPSSLAPTSDGGLPPLEMPGARPNTSSMPDLLPLPSERFRGRVLESTPIEAILPPLDAPPIRSSTARPRGITALPPIGTPGRSRTLLDESDLLDPIDMKDEGDLKGRDKDGDKAPTPPPRRLNLFSRFALRPIPTTSDSEIKAEPRSDPAADAAIKRRVERQAKDVVGDRVKAVDVKVVGRSITIQARGVKFLQKRTIRRSLESLPGLSGYRSVVEVLD